MMNSLRCQCDAVQGQVDSSQRYFRAVCYCKDCQAYARFLGRPDQVLDQHGGTEIAAVSPAAIQFTAGTENFACMSLSPKGILRWYANCCRTPIGNTTRNRKIAYVGLVRACLPTLDESFGPLKVAVNTQSGAGDVKTTPVATFLGVAGTIKGVIGARLSGKFKQNPFFDPDSGTPIKAPHVISHAERQALTR